MDVIEIAHQTPLTPIVAAKIMASGMRTVLKTMLTIAGGVVLPTPLNIPCVVSSSIINT